MADYHKLYLKLFNIQTDAIAAMQDTAGKLIQAHQEAEEEIVSAPEPRIQVLRREVETPEEQ
jgi:ABC-type nitrate/sulfonate/bicarbonate transport system substrate-binding protein